jgi:hypothetical protein
MKPKDLSEIKKEAKDMFSFILISCPDWHPLLKEMTTAKAFNHMIDLLNIVLEKAKADNAKQWLRICLQELRTSWKHYEDGNLKAGRETIQQAEEYFNNAISKKPIEARFVSGESGAALDSKKGFHS